MKLNQFNVPVGTYFSFWALRQYRLEKLFDYLRRLSAQQELLNRLVILDNRLRERFLRCLSFLSLYGFPLPNFNAHPPHTGLRGLSHHGSDYMQKMIHCCNLFWSGLCSRTVLC